MTPIIQLSALCRACFTLWGLLVCLAGAICLVWFVWNRKCRLCLASLACTASAILLWQVLYDIYRMNRGARAQALTLILGGCAWIGWVMALLALTAGIVLLMNRIRYHSENSLTPMTIKTYTDMMPVGLCYWRPDGRVILSNHCINQLCIALTDRPLLNGNILRDAVTDAPMLIDGKYWRFAVRSLQFEGRPLMEMIATDVTAQQQDADRLKADTERLSELKSALMAYGREIDDIVRREEILQAKIAIHDDINQLILSSMEADETDGKALDKVFEPWKKELLLLSAEERFRQYEESRMDELSQALGIQLIRHNSMPQSLTEKQRELLFIAAREAVINAVKHGHAKQVEIDFQETNAEIRCLWRNAGTTAEGEVEMQGGLKNLRELAQRQGAEITVSGGEKFTLCLIFRKKP